MPTLLLTRGACEFVMMMMIMVIGHDGTMLHCQAASRNEAPTHTLAVTFEHVIRLVRARTCMRTHCAILHLWLTIPQSSARLATPADSVPDALQSPAHLLADVHAWMHSWQQLFQWQLHAQHQVMSMHALTAPPTCDV